MFERSCSDGKVRRGRRIELMEAKRWNCLFWDVRYVGGFKVRVREGECVRVRGSAGVLE